MGSSKGQQKSTSKQTIRPDQYAYDLYKNILERAEEVGQQPYTAYQGEQVAGFTPDQLAAFQAIRQAQGAGAGTLQQGVEAAGRGVAAITPEDIQRYQDPYQQAVVESTLARMRTGAEEDISGLKGKQIMAGAFGGDRARIGEAALRRDQAEQRNRVVSDLMSKGYSQSLAAAQADREAALRGSQQLGSLASMEFAQPLAQAQALGGIGTAQQQLAQQYLNVPYQQFLEERAYPYQQLQWLAGLGTGVGSQMGTIQKGTQTQTPAQPSMFGQLLGAGLGIASLPLTGGGSLGGNFLSSFSDERLKENIEDVGVTHDGQTIYKYNYKGDPKTHIGLLAQEVEQVHPESVGQVAGFKVVNYDTATKDAVRKADGGPVMPYGGTGIPTPMAYPGAPNISPLRFMEPQETQDETQQLVSKAVKLAKSIKEGMNKPTTEGWEATVTPTAPVEPVTREPLPPVRMPEPEPVRPMDYKMPESASMTMAESPFSYYMPKADGGEVEKSSSLLEKATGLELSDAARQGLLAAGLGMLSSRSPFAGTAIGEGGLRGLGVYQTLKAGEQEAEAERQKLAQQAEAEKARLEREQAQLARQRYDKLEQTTKTGEPVFFDKDLKQNVKFIGGRPVPVSGSDMAPSAAERGRWKETGMFTQDGRPIVRDEYTNETKVMELPEGVDKVVSAPTAVDLTEQKEAAKLRAKAKSALPGAEQVTQRAVNLVDEIISDPKLSSVTGMSSYLPSGPKAKTLEAKIAQLSGTAFISAFESLKGAGAITEKEGAAAEAALARLRDLSQDEEGYKQALLDFRKEVQSLLNVVRQKSGLEPTPVLPSNVPYGSLFSPSRNQWKTPSGKILNIDGTPAGE